MIINIKQILLKTSYFDDNKYLDKYCDLILANWKRKKEKNNTQAHHMIPVALYKINSPDKSLNRYAYIKVANSDNNNHIVNLTYYDHILAHYYLSLCSLRELKTSMCSAFWQLSHLTTIKDLDYEKVNELYRIHKESFSEKRRGHVTTVQTKQKMSNARKGISPGNKGVKGVYAWYTNGETNLHLKITEASIPEGFYKGRVTNRHWYTNGSINILIAENADIPEGFYKGMSVSEETKKLMSEKALQRDSKSYNHGPISSEHKLKISQTLKNKNRHWYTDGINNILCSEEDCPQGWYKGETHSEIWINNLKSSAQERSKTCPPPSQKGKKWINNEIKSKLISVDLIPEYLNSGWKIGKIPPTKEQRMKMSEAHKKPKQL